MTISTPTGSSPNALARAATYAIRVIVRSRVGLLVLAVAALGLGLTFNWSWLVAAGIAPVILSLLPCAAMCALGLCMTGMASRSSAAQPSLQNVAGAPGSEAPSRVQFIASSDGSDDGITAADQPVDASDVTESKSFAALSERTTAHVRVFER